MQKYNTVDEFLNGLNEDKKLQVEALRDLILTTAPSLEEHIKWNAPSYVLNGEDRITFNTMNKQEVVKLVFHMGATRRENKNGTPVMHDESTLIEWTSDIRGVVTFNTYDEVTSSLISLKKIIQKWLSTPAV